MTYQMYQLEFFVKCKCTRSLCAAAASDDEGSTAATDGSTLRTSPAEHGGSAGSESGGSAVDSITGEHSGKKAIMEYCVSALFSSFMIRLNDVDNCCQESL